MKKPDLIRALRKEKYVTVIPSSSKITVVREFGNKRRKSIAFTLEPQKRGKYFLRHPNYLFISTVSHFKSTQDDVRLSLNKTYISWVIKTLKNVGVWPFIINKDFIVVNDNNKKSHKGKVKKELVDLLA